MLKKQATCWLVLLLVLPVTVSADQNTTHLSAADNYVAYPGQTVQHHIDVTYSGESGVALKLDLQTQYLSNVNGNGQELVFNDGETKRFIWTMTLPQTTPLGTDTIQITIIDTSDLSNKSIDVEMKITVASNIYFGSIQSSSFVVDPGIRTNLAMNITSNATMTDDVTFSIQTDASWNWGWTMDAIEGMTSSLQLTSNSMDFVRIWVDVPEIIDGAPLANQGPTFRLIGTSGLDFVNIAWDFTLEVSSFRNVTIDSVEENVLVDPAGNTRVDVQVRNTGNTPDTVSITLGNLKINGEVSMETDSDRITSNGWTVALFNAYEDVILMPNESRIVEIGVEAPSVTSGTIEVDLILNPTNFQFRTVRETASVSISWVRDFEHELLPGDCTYIQPNSSCSGSLSVQNIGNYADSFVLELNTAPQFISNVVFPELPIQLDQYEATTFNAIEFTIDGNATAYQQGSISFDMKLNGGQVLQTYSIDVVVGPNVAWTFLDGQSEVDSQDVVNFAVQLRNDGNLEDGLIVQLQSSHSTEMGFTPPNGAIIDGDSERPRTFELGNLPREANFTLRGTAELPADQTANGTLVLDIVVRSIFDPETEFIFTIEEEFLGKQWKVEQEKERYSLSELVRDIGLIIKGWWLIVVCVAISSIVINKAVRDRIQRNEQDELLRQFNEQPEETQDNWMEKFNKPSTQQPQIVESPTMSRDAFEKAFQSQSTPSAPALEPLPEPIRDAATTVLDHHDMSSQRATMDKIASDIINHGVSMPHQENENLEPSTAITQRTIRHENLTLTPTPRAQENVPLPSEVDEEDEFDL
jgi:hypothetical protein